MGHAGVHDAVTQHACLDGGGNGSCRGDRVDRPHVIAVAAADRPAAAVHAQRRARERLLDVVDGDGVAAEERVHVAVADEPGEDVTSARMQHRRADHPHDVSPTPALLAEDRRDPGVVHRLLAAHLRAHELELVIRGAARAEEAGGVHVDPFTAVLGRAQQNTLAGAHVPRLEDAERAVVLLHDHGVHPWMAGGLPRAILLHVGRQVGRREESFGEDAIGRSRREARVRCRLQAVRAEIRRSITDIHHTERTI